VLVRDVVQVSTPYGPCPVKLGRLGPLIVRLHPEADVVSDLARRHGVSFESVASAVREAARSALGMHA
jgi:uncharacterized protein (DUF111 family)